MESREIPSYFSYLISLLAVLLIVTSVVTAARIEGLKFEDTNRDGIYKPGIDLPVPGWNISLYYLWNGTSTGLFQHTDASGRFDFPDMDDDTIFVVREEIQSGWKNSTPDTVVADFKNSTLYPLEYFGPGLPAVNTAFVTRSLWGSSGNYHQDIHWEPFSVKNTTRVGMNPYWLNKTEYSFTLTYDPALAPHSIIYTVSGPLTQGQTTTTISASPDFSGNRFPFDEIDVYSRANTNISRAYARMEISDLVLTVNGTGYPISNSSVADCLVPPAQTHLILRSSRIAEEDITHGFTLTGKQNFTYWLGSGNRPTNISSAAFAATFSIGKNQLTPYDVTAEFGNIPTSISGIKFNDLNGNGVKDINEGPLAGWQIRLTQPNGTVVTTTTAGDGSYRFTKVPFGVNKVEEILQPKWEQKHPVSPSYHLVEVNESSFDVPGINFGNMPLPDCCGCPVLPRFTPRRTGTLTYTFTDTSRGDVRDWYWDFGDASKNPERYEKNPKHTFPKPGTYTVKLSVMALKCDGKRPWASKSVRIRVS